jgi:non-specific serine/threonine protein kinase/serine/threonine-protein kinase
MKGKMAKDDSPERDDPGKTRKISSASPDPDETAFVVSEIPDSDESTLVVSTGPDSEDDTRADSTETVTGEAATPATPAADVPRQIGNYQLVRSIGEGGMGEVWEAEQLRPLRRRVALKVIKVGMDTREFTARFETERQALAMMDHPYIASVFDAGTTERGRPFFVMEYVEGVPVTDHCNAHNHSIPERLELFIKVCEGIQHAHQKAIIHRDIKPSNVLVTIQDGTAWPKIIDFGVAKAIDQKLADHTVHTELGQFIGTPAYMSPEQVDMTGQNIDTRTDIYMLGVLLYELLTGVLPFDMDDLLKTGIASLLQHIQQVEPPRPSTPPGEA